MYEKYKEEKEDHWLSYLSLVGVMSLIDILAKSLTQVGGTGSHDSS